MSEVSAFLIGAVLGAVFTINLVTIFTDSPREVLKKYQQEAIDAGVAHWEVDPKTGATKFCYIVPVKP